MQAFGIRAYVLLLALAPAALIAGILGTYFTVERLDELSAALRQRTGATAEHLAVASQFGVVSGDVAMLQELSATTAHEADVVAAGVFDVQGKKLASEGLGSDLARRVQPLFGPHSSQSEIDGLVISVAPIVLRALSSRDLFEQPRGKAVAMTPPLGYAVVVMSRSSTDVARASMMKQGLGIIGIGLAVTGLIAFLLAGRISKPIVRLSQAVQRLRTGDLTSRVPADSSAELLNLQIGFNEMVGSLDTLNRGLQEQVREATQELRMQKEEAERANIAKSRFLAAASHDLRQPLHALGLFLSVLENRVQGEESRVVMRNMGDAVTALDELLNALLDISKLDAGVMQQRSEPVAIGELLDQVRNQFASAAAQKGLRLIIRPCRVLVHSDAVMLRRILVNLVSNAVRYTSHGGILVGCRRRQDRLRVEVWDTGIGIPEDKSDVIFEEFVQLQNPERDRSKGLGLGLAIVARSAKLLGCPLSMRSRVGKGSVFAVELPIVTEVAPSLEEVPLPLPEETSIADLTVAVVDDDTVILVGMQALLSEWGCRVVVARNGNELFHGLGAAVPDIVLSDYRLVDEDGIEVLNRVRERYGVSVPCVLITGDTHPERLQKARQSGYQVLHKPVGAARLRLLLTMAAKNRRRAAA